MIVRAGQAAEAAAGGLAAMAAAALTGAEATKAMGASAGRASYVRAELVRTVPDPGAMALALALQGAVKASATPKL